MKTTPQPGMITIQYKEIKGETTHAIHFQLGTYNKWVPRSIIGRFEKAKLEFEIPQWFYDREMLRR